MLKACFGKNSEESGTCYDTLNEFRLGKITKRDVYFAIVDQLGDDKDLNEEFSILLFEDAGQGPENFQAQRCASSSHQYRVSPESLQPDHEPQLPTLSTLEQCNAVQSTQSGLDATLSQISNPTPLNQTLYTGVGNGPKSYGSYHQPTHPQNAESNLYSSPIAPSIANSSPPAQLSAQFRNWNLYSLPVLGTQVPSLQSDYSFAHAPRIGSGIGNGSQPQSSSLGDAWSHDDPENVFARSRLDDNLAGSHHVCTPALSSLELTLQAVSPQERPTNLGHSVLRTPISVLQGRTVCELSPPSKYIQNESRIFDDTVGEHAGEKAIGVFQGPTSYELPSPTKHMPKEALIFSDTNEEHVDEESGVTIPLHSTRHASSSSLFIASSSSRRPSRTPSSGSFVHIICNRGFPTRLAVKKHHWGARVNDMLTKTGCWHKHNRPDIAWDDHPSCKLQPRARAPPKAKELKRKSEPAVPKFKASALPTMILNAQNTQSGFPTLEELPKLVAQTVSAMPTQTGFGRQEETSAYRSFGYPDRVVGVRNLDALTKAPGATSRIATPNQSYYGEAVSSLNTQFTAVGGSGTRFDLSCMSPVGQQDDVPAGQAWTQYLRPLASLRPLTPQPATTQAVEESTANQATVTAQELQGGLHSEESAGPDLAVSTSTGTSA
ncbi:uncharacterized protein BDR25DRAFT_84446 [Lindgomyces ingoldianus]|uniref:Uncharacterized protein n=1 Tax=Lindgomyces ingoldianus TaxID=673940 RepID=A0ACB6QES2_9PLEO|nr:uncharacterized protein BDR25DRAFT_84446 [Lindgomyces ingoldianus]KAF2465499.1 hypothetical protein BDR25DRAFT_84446 [Lindgomyces ingoldianus]